MIVYLPECENISDIPSVHSLKKIVIFKEISRNYTVLHPRFFYLIANKYLIKFK